MQELETTVEGQIMLVPKTNHTKETMVQERRFEAKFQKFQTARSNCKGYYSIPSVSIGRINSSSMNLIRLILQRDTPVCLYIIPSIVRVFIRLYFKWIANTQLRRSLIQAHWKRSRDLNAGTKQREKYMNNIGNPSTVRALLKTISSL